MRAVFFPMPSKHLASAADFSFLGYDYDQLFQHFMTKQIMHTLYNDIYFDNLASNT